MSVWGLGNDKRKTQQGPKIVGRWCTKRWKTARDFFFFKTKRWATHPPRAVCKRGVFFPNAIICLGFTSRRGRVRRRDARSIRIGSSSRFEKNTIFYRSRQKKKIMDRFLHWRKCRFHWIRFDNNNNKNWKKEIFRLFG